MSLFLALGAFAVLGLFFFDKHLKRDKDIPEVVIREIVSDLAFWLWVLSVAWLLYELSKLVEVLNL